MRLPSIRVSTALIGCGLILGIFPAPLRAQAAQTVIRADVNLVRVMFTAFDGRGKHLTGIARSDVEIYEDGISQSIEYFRGLTGSDTPDEPLAVVLLVDTSGSVKDKLALEQTIALNFLKQVLRAGKDMAAILQFDSRVRMVQNFTSDFEKMEAMLRSLTANGSTSLYDAIYLAAEETLKPIIGRKVLVVVSDGEDTSSKKTRKEAIEAAQKNDVAIFAVGVNTQSYRPEFTALKESVQQTGGRFFHSRSTTKEMTRAFGEVTETLKKLYNVSYYSTNQRKDGTFRLIRVRLKRRNVRVQHRVGYYAPG